MGVLGLKTFLYRQNGVLRPHKLRKTRLIMDGNNLSHLLSKQVDGIFGGDYGIYYRMFKDLFLNLLKCEIQPIVIFDGCFPYKKENLVQQRKNDKLKKLLNKDCNSELEVTVNPVFLFDVFCQVLRELQIEHRQLYEDADSVIAHVARYFDCPVLSDDSDFFIYDVSYVPFDKVVMEAKEDGNQDFYIPCSLYKAEYLIDRFPKLQKSMLPLLPLLLGNGIVDRSLFRNAFLRKNKVKEAFRWLQRWKNEKEAKIAMLNFLKVNSRNRADSWENVIEECMNNYSISNPCPLSHVNMADFTPKSFIDTISKMPRRFVERFENCKLHTTALAISLDKLQYMPLQMEDMKQKSPYYISIPILQSTYKIIKGMKGEKEEKSTMNIYIRNGDHYELCQFDVDDGFDCDMRNIMDAEEHTRRGLFFRCLDIEDGIVSVDRFDKDWTLFLISVMYWMKNTEGLDRSLLSAVLLMALANYAERKFEDADSHSGLLESVSPMELEQFVRKFSKWRVPDRKITERESFYPIIHLFASLQSCMICIAQLNYILAEPFQEMDVIKLYSGTLLLNIYFKTTVRFGCLDSLLQNLQEMQKIYVHLEQLLVNRTLPVQGSAKD